MNNSTRKLSLLRISSPTAPTFSPNNTTCLPCARLTYLLLGGEAWVGYFEYVRGSRCQHVPVSKQDGERVNRPNAYGDAFTYNPTARRDLFSVLQVVAQLNKYGEA